MSDISLQIKIDSAPAQSGAAAIRAELDSLKAKCGDVWGAFASLGTNVGASFSPVASSALAAAASVDRMASSATAATSSIHEVIRANTGLGDGFKSAANSADVFAAKMVSAWTETKVAQTSIHSAISAATGLGTGLKSAADAADVFVSKMKRIEVDTRVAQSSIHSLISASTGLGQGWKSAADSADVFNRLMPSMNSHTASAASAFGNVRFVVANAGAQISDLAIVATMGGNNIAQMGIQVGQFLGILGPAGAVMGAAATAGGVLAQSLLKAGEASEAAELRAKTYENGLKELVALENDYNKALRERAGLPALPTSTDNTERQLREAQGRVRGLQQQDDRGFGQKSIDWASSTINDVKQWWGGEKSHERGEALAGLGHATANMSAANDVAEATDKTRLVTVINDLTEKRQRDLEVTRLATTEREREAAMLKAEYDIRERLKGKQEVSSDDIEAQVKAAREQAAAVYDLKQAQEDREKAARDAERDAKRREQDRINRLHEELRLLQMKADAERAGSQGKVTATAATADFAKTNFGPASAEYKTANAAVLQAERELQREKMQLAQEAANGEVALSKVALQAERESLDQRVTLGEISAAERLEILRNLTQQEAALELDSLTTAQQTYERGTVAWEQAENKKLLAAANLNRQLAVLDRQGAANRLSMVKEWTSPFTAGINSMVQGFGQGTLTMGQMARRSGAVIATSYASKFATVATDWFNQHVVMAAWDKLFAQQAVGTKAAEESQKQSIVAGSEAAQTGAVVGGVTARTSAQVTGAATEKTVKSSSIMTSASETFANVYDNVSKIPYVGWILAPAAASVAFAAVAAKSVFSAEGGWEHVPADGLITELHKDEKVLSAPFARRLDKLMNNVDAMQTPASAFSAAAMPSFATGVSAWATAPLMAGAGMNLLNVGRAGEGMSIPAVLSRPSNNNVQNTTNNTASNSSFAPVLQLTVNGASGWDNPEAIRRNARHIAKAMKDELRNFNPNSRPRV